MPIREGITLDPTVFVHPMALVDTPHVGPRTRVWPFAHLMEGARVGSDCNICEGVFVEGKVVIGDAVTVKNGVALFDGVTIEDEVFIGPQAVFTNDLRPRAGRMKHSHEDWLATRVRRGASIGANVTIVCGSTVGEYAMIAAGAVVTHDVSSHALMAGVPARFKEWVCACSRSLPATLACTCGRFYEAGARGLVERFPDEPKTLRGQGTIET
jgi:UDP-2-acetamido-3-amino-2,3-dideoxy-glucuronate N-acetyltransferase